MNFMKKITAVAVLGLATAAPAWANDLNETAKQSQAVESTIKPYLVAGNFAEDRSRVFMFFSYSCPYCAQVWVGMDRWGATLPRDWRYVPVPVITNEKSSKVAATAYYIVRELAPGRLSEFNRLAYAVGGNNRDTSGQGYIRALYQMGFKAADIERVANSDVTQERLARALALSHRYNIRSTPTFAVGGRYTTHAGFTNGDYEVLVQLLNALVSMTIQGEPS